MIAVYLFIYRAAISLASCSPAPTGLIMHISRLDDGVCKKTLVAHVAYMRQKYSSEAEVLVQATYLVEKIQ